jgi:cell division protein FtsL
MATTNAKILTVLGSMLQEHWQPQITQLDLEIQELERRMDEQNQTINKLKEHIKTLKIRQKCTHESYLYQRWPYDFIKFEK